MINEHTADITTAISETHDAQNASRNEERSRKNHPHWHLYVRSHLRLTLFGVMLNMQAPNRPQFIMIKRLHSWSRTRRLNWERYVLWMWKKQRKRIVYRSNYTFSTGTNVYMIYCSMTKATTDCDCKDILPSSFFCRMNATG